MPSGIYKILNTINGKFYIGSSDFIRRRWREHVVTLNGNKHGNSYLQNAWNKYGKDAFEFSVVEYCETSMLTEKEQFWLDWLRPYDEAIGYNIISNARRGTLGLKLPPEFGQKVRERKLGVALSAEHKANIAAGNRGKVMSQDAIDKIRASKAHDMVNQDRWGVKYDKPNRIWACPDGQKCKCHPCRTRKSDYVRKYREKKANQQ